ncbi:uncharacterized protein LOC131932837 [Physella acuta]|uniref:uncharacterized protein LOC131932837 n=1 Tax=Physella acuta TaxID=109671 RepID=UPI0027DC9BA1|nr:uncharacterized protein LOC131932837 [Physella acuta]XP_059145728.1 uncharacterized protein LOC131932837 [Physella acuta]XP_059145729.1 uncharacterized protein LOC131932837 [Physella acuta]XP_059145730.1 uncharacterized protein LOC131932837 [Physella acuta]
MSANCTAGDDAAEDKVVMRRSRNLFAPAFDHVDHSKKPGEKHVKWSESTELRERMKVYRRSQLDMPLDYHHIALEEKREKAGVKEWRSSLLKDDTDDEEETEQKISPLALVPPPAAEAAAVSEDPDSTDSDEPDNLYDFDIDKMLHIIKIKTTKYTVYPAYCSAVDAYSEWLSNKDNTKNLTEEQLKTKQRQLDLYKRVVGLYENWGDQDDDEMSCTKYNEINSLLEESTALGPAPDCVASLITEVINAEENAQKQVEVYNDMVQEIITSIDTSVEV